MDLAPTLDPLPLGRIWLIGGTSEALTLARELDQNGIPCLVTVTTEAAQRAYPLSSNLTVRVGPITIEHLPDFIHTHRIGAILDASHPFAVEISQGAIAAAQALNIPYWRYERPAVPENRLPPDSLIRRVPDLSAALTEEILVGQRVLLTLGYRWLAAFQPWQHSATLFARILPSAMALEAALTAGFTPDRLIALRPPIGATLEAALWQQWQITTVITKASGQPGGEGVKQAIAQRLGVALIVIDRPQLAYPVVVETVAAGVSLCRQWWIDQNLTVTF